ncbi:Putative cytochrome P450 120 [Nocardia otitidiscaviarum]|uniref:Cytochrome P450 120 n=1 Tax=Nocardia otitidiscaviarum TaxID=1823 RepID=A0A379JLT4_9NOCA|nr:cytochrome P450 [Nocardia otitidiscaviarum]SUD49324.1 Putative cytochrome P450 120 [Nocardia otitidiscaviarum]
MSTPTLPSGPSTPGFVHGIQILGGRTRAWRRWHRRYGSAFTVQMPRFGSTVVLSDPAEVKALFTASTDQVDTVDVNLGQVLGPGSLFSLEGEEHRKQRKLLTPPFHGRRLAVYEQLIEDEAVREMANWPEGVEFATMDSMMRITLNVILRAVFGAEGSEFDELRSLLPKLVLVGSALAALPIPRGFLGNYGPWARFAAHRRAYDDIVGRLIDRATRDPELSDRNDVLAMLVQTRYDDGSAMSRRDIADELLTLLTAGHETTATTLAWTVERLRRHPDILRRLVEEADAGGSELREATLVEVQRVRPVIDATPRQIRAESFQLGRWTLPRGQKVLVNIRLVHDNEELFPNARTFDPDRFLGVRPNTWTWIPFGGGARRCIGASFASLELNIVLRTLLRDFTLETTAAPDERPHFRGVALVPAKKGRAVVRRRVRPERERVVELPEPAPNSEVTA